MSADLFSYATRFLALLASLILVPPLALRADEPPAVDELEAPSVSPEQIQAWIKQLGNDDFQTREAAQKALVRAGNPAYFALDALPPSADPEIKTRVEQTLIALEDDAAAQLRKLGASVLRRNGAKHWNHLDLENPDLRDEDLAPLLRLKHLEHLELKEAPFSDHALSYCRNLTKLREFSSYRTQISDTGLEKLAFPTSRGRSPKSA